MEPKPKCPRAGQKFGSPKLIGIKATEADALLLTKLPHDHRAILKMTGTYKAIAATLGIPEGTARSRLNRARKALLALREASVQAKAP